MRIRTKNYQIILNDNNGSLDSFSNHRREFISRSAQAKSLFSLRLRDAKGKPFDLNSLDSEKFYAHQIKRGDSTITVLRYSALRSLALDVEVRIRSAQKDPCSYWNLSLENKTRFVVEWVEFPEIIVPNDLVGNGGDSRVLWPNIEGVLIENVDMRRGFGMEYEPVEYPSRPFESVYPGPCTTQFLAYYGEKGGLYIGAHDPKDNVKTFEYYKYRTGIKFEFRLFPGEPLCSNYRMKYDMVLGTFSGDWHDAAQIYRNWHKKSQAVKPSRLFKNKKLPKWLEDSPVVVIYPVRGHTDTGQMKPNDYFPYGNAIPHLKKLGEDFDSKVMALLMHWEGTAPWAPPYVWPPYGGKKQLKDFIEELHKSGHLAGLYCSGIAWTNQSLLVPEYDKRQEFQRKNLAEAMCAGPGGSLPYSSICNGTQRWGYDMCPTHPFVSEVACQEVSRMLKSGTDYIQFFDQNIGARPYACYSPSHGHPPVPGHWQNAAMIRLMKKIKNVVDKSKRNIIIGCEGAAAQPFIPYLLFNDLRFNFGLYLGRPVPLYQYLYHEYINNFMGNQCCLAFDSQRSPENLFWRVAYSFIAGDLTSVILREEGLINWSWQSPWSGKMPDQKLVRQFVKTLNSWRKGRGKPYLFYGQMEKPYKIIGAKNLSLKLKQGQDLKVPSLLTSRWKSPDGGQAQFVVNWTSQPGRFELELGDYKKQTIRVSGEQGVTFVEVKRKKATLECGAFSVLMVEL